jgi:hypothetical protein
MQKIIVIDVIIQLTELLQWVCLTKMLSVRIAKKQKRWPDYELARNTESEEVKKAITTTGIYKFNYN